MVLSLNSSRIRGFAPGNAAVPLPAGVLVFPKDPTAGITEIGEFGSHGGSGVMPDARVQLDPKIPPERDTDVVVAMGVETLASFGRQWDRAEVALAVDVLKRMVEWS